MAADGYEVGKWSAVFAEWAIGGFEDSWATWQEDGEVPLDEPAPKLQAYHPKAGWSDMVGDPLLGGTFRLVAGPAGIEAILGAIPQLKAMKQAAAEDGAAAAKDWRSMLTGAQALARKFAGR